MLLSCWHSFRRARLFLCTHDEHLFSNPTLPVLSYQVPGQIKLSWCLGRKPGVSGGPSPAIITLSMYSTSYISPLHTVNCLLCQLNYANDNKISTIAKIVCKLNASVSNMDRWQYQDRELK